MRERSARDCNASPHERARLAAGGCTQLSACRCRRKIAGGGDKVFEHPLVPMPGTGEPPPGGRPWASSGLWPGIGAAGCPWRPRKLRQADAHLVIIGLTKNGFQ
jgi:hypothetical protein